MRLLLRLDQDKIEDQKAIILISLKAKEKAQLQTQEEDKEIVIKTEILIEKVTTK